MHPFGCSRVLARRNHSAYQNEALHKSAHGLSFPVPSDLVLMLYGGVSDNGAHSEWVHLFP